MKLISVIIPVYKVEAYLDWCLQTVVNQTYDNLEIILVDDGSPDRSGELCDLWSKKDMRIRVIHQENSGGAAARNRALDIAKGDIIAFVDSDDYISSDMFEHLAGILNNGADIAECEFINVQTDNEEFPETADEETRYTTEAALKLHIEDKCFKQIIWNKLYKKEVISDIRFTEGKSIDDEYFTYLVIANANVLVHSSKVCYAYRMQNDSVMHSMGVAKRMHGLEARERRHNYIKEHYPDLKRESLIDLWFLSIYLGQLILRASDKSEKPVLIGKITDVLKRNPINAGDLSEINLKQRMWLLMAKHTFMTACSLRNRLQIGL